LKNINRGPRATFCFAKYDLTVLLAATRTVLFLLRSAAKNQTQYQFVGRLFFPRLSFMDFMGWFENAPKQQSGEWQL
jgi:hypothetical protein